MATAAPRPGVDKDERRRQLLEAELRFHYDDRDLVMTVGDVNGIAERDCINGGGLPPLAVVQYVAEIAAGSIEHMSLRIMASLLFYAFRQAGDDTRGFEQILEDIDYTKTFEIVSAVPDVADLIKDGSPDPTNGV